MLKSIGKVLSLDPINAALRAPRPTEISEGVYRGGFNFDHDLRASGFEVNEYPFSLKWDKFVDSGLEPGTPEHLALLQKTVAMPNDYGVCDRWEQIVERWPELLTDPRHFVIGLAEVRTEAQSPQGGWRWHKWGEYIGDFEPQQEYLYDEVGIDRVFTFHILEILS